MLNKYETMTFCMDEYANSEEMWKDISKFMEILLKNKNKFVVRQEENIVIVIDYQHDESYEYYGCAQPVWLDEDEQEYLNSYEAEDTENTEETSEED